MTKCRSVLERLSDNLFIKDSSKAKLEIRDCVNDGTLNEADSNHSIARLSAPCLVSTEEHLYETMKVMSQSFSA